MPKPKPATPTPPWIWVFLIALVGLIAHTVGSKKPPPGAVVEPSISPWLGVGLVFGAFVVMIAALYAVTFWRFHDRDASRAWKLMKAGDKDGALFEMKAAMDGRKPSAVRSSMLGLIHFGREEWAEAYQAFLDAEAIGGRQPVTLGNQGLALFKLGRTDEAEPLVREACALMPASPIFACNLGFILLEQGRLDDVARQLTIAEQNLRKMWLISASDRKMMTDEIDRLRAKLQAGPATGMRSQGLRACGSPSRGFRPGWGHWGLGGAGALTSVEL